MNRQGFIGGSDMYRIRDGDWHKLWLEKTGRAEPEDLSGVLPVQLGTYTESFNISWFCKQYAQREPVIVKRNTTLRVEIDGIHLAPTIDAAIRFNDGNENMLECKHTNERTNMEEQLTRYMPQIQAHLRVMPDPDAGGYFSVIFGNNRWEAVHVAFDREYFNSMWSLVSDFWSYVLRDEEPPHDVPVDGPSHHSIPVDDMVIRDASQSNSWAEAEANYLEHRESAAVFEGAKKDLKAMVGDNEREVFGKHVRIKRDKRGALRFSDA
jgi:predicted phage-related endonuclease